MGVRLFEMRITKGHTQFPVCEVIQGAIPPGQYTRRLLLFFLRLLGSRLATCSMQFSLVYLILGSYYHYREVWQWIGISDKVSPPGIAIVGVDTLCHPRGMEVERNLLHRCFGFMVTRKWLPSHALDVIVGQQSLYGGLRIKTPRVRHLPYGVRYIIFSGFFSASLLSCIWVLSPLCRRVAVGQFPPYRASQLYGSERLRMALLHRGGC